MIKHLTTFSWSPGQGYSPPRPDLRADLFEVDTYDYLILFEDPARMITGIIPVMNVRHFVLDEYRGSIKWNTGHFRDHVMWMYNRGQYESWSIWMRRGPAEDRKMEEVKASQLKEARP